MCGTDRTIPVPVLLDARLAAMTRHKSHSITSSARSRNACGIFRPSALAVMSVDDKIELDRLLQQEYRRAWLPRRIVRHSLPRRRDGSVDVARRRTHQAADFDELWRLDNIVGDFARHAARVYDANPLAGHQWIAVDIQRIAPRLQMFRWRAMSVGCCWHFVRRTTSSTERARSNASTLVDVQPR